MLMNDIHTLLYRQYTYITKIPNIKDLENNGLLDSIIKVINLHPDLIIHQPLVEQYTDEYLAETLTHHEFISFEKIDLLLRYLKNTNSILKQDTLKLLTRIKPYLSFITDDKIQEVRTQLDNNEDNILDVFTVNELKLILDKEVELKYLLFRALTPDKIQEMFDKFKQELIAINLGLMVEQKVNELMDDLLSRDYTDLIKDQVDNYMMQSYDSLMRDTIANTFQTFQDNLTIEIKDEVQQAFNNLSPETLQIIQNQVNAVLDESFPVLTDQQVQDWILIYR
jgi:hypothetical protein